jgi:phage terminase large subunit-like protein
VTAGALASTSPIGDRRGARDARIDRRPPPWRKWRTRSRAARCIRFVETYCRVPSGARHGELISLARFQRDELDELLAPGVRSGGIQIPRGNGKSTLWAAVGLWALADHEDAPQIPLVAFNGLQAMRTLYRPAARMVTIEPELRSRMVPYTSNTDRRIWCAWNDGELLALPADENRLQGLNPSVALVDEAQTIPPEVLRAVQQGAGKRPESLVLAIGTPAPGAQASALFDLRERVRAGAPVAWIEYAATAGCALDDRREWRRANPALAAGFLYPDVFDLELSAMPEPDFRMYRLGQWVDVIQAGWLPLGAWEACPTIDVPPDGTEIVLGLAGTWTSSIAIVGATLDGELFLAYSADVATDDQLDSVLADAWSRWQIVELVVAPRVRGGLVRRLGDGGMPVTVWPNRVDLEVSSSTEWRRAIVEGRVPHDHHPLIGEHVAALVGHTGGDGNLRLVAPDDGRDVDAARAARMAWYRAVEQADRPAPAIY